MHVSIVSARPQAAIASVFHIHQDTPTGSRPLMMHWTMLSYEDIILLGEERVLVIQEQKEGRCWCGQTWH
jgi:hypothetical protein